MVRDLPAWALQENSDPKLPKEISPSGSVAGQCEATPPPLLPLMTIGEAATILHVSPRTIRRIIERGELEVVRIGRSIRVRREDIKQIISGET
jgi:excisionase family DNA binding protein